MRNLLLLLPFAIAQIGVKASATNTDWDNTDGVDLVYSEGTAVKYCYYNDQPTCDCNIYKAASSFESLPGVSCIAIPSNPKCRMKHPTTQIWSWCGREQIVIYVSYTVEEDEYNEFLASQNDRINALADSLNVDPSQVVITDVAVVDATRRMLQGMQVCPSEYPESLPAMYLYCCKEEGACCNQCKLPVGRECVELGYPVDTWSVGRHTTQNGTPTEQEAQDVCCQSNYVPLNNACTQPGEQYCYTEDPSVYVILAGDFQSLEIGGRYANSCNNGCVVTETSTNSYTLTDNSETLLAFGSGGFSIEGSTLTWVNNVDYTKEACEDGKVFDHIVVDAPVVEQPAVRARAESDAFLVAYRERIRDINPNWSPMTVDRSEYRKLIGWCIAFLGFELVMNLIPVLVSQILLPPKNPILRLTHLPK